MSHGKKLHISYYESFEYLGIAVLLTICRLADMLQMTAQTFKFRPPTAFGQKQCRLALPGSDLHPKNPWSTKRGFCVGQYRILIDVILFVIVIVYTVALQ